MFANPLPPFQVAQHQVALVSKQLAAAGINSPQTDARALVALAAQHTGSLVLINRLPDDFYSRLNSFVQRRLNHEPLQHIQGFAPFRKLQLKTAKGVFIPRPETEVAIDQVHAWIKANNSQVESASGQGTGLQIIDACTGSGTLAAACLDEIPNSQVTAFDLNPAAVELARENCELAAVGKTKNGAGAKLAERFKVFVAQLPAIQSLNSQAQAALAQFSQEQPLPAQVDIFLSNPPYIPARAIPRDLEVMQYDPPESLFGGGDDGLDVPRAVVLLAALTLKSGGLLIMEHADLQGAQTRNLAIECGEFNGVQTIKDLTGRDRFLRAIKK